MVLGYAMTSKRRNQPMVLLVLLYSCKIFGTRTSDHISLCLHNLCFGSSIFIWVSRLAAARPFDSEFENFTARLGGHIVPRKSTQGMNQRLHIVDVGYVFGHPCLSGFFRSTAGTDLRANISSLVGGTNDKGKTHLSLKRKTPEGITPLF